MGGNGRRPGELRCEYRSKNLIEIYCGCFLYVVKYKRNVRWIDSTSGLALVLDTQYGKKGSSVRESVRPCKCDKRKCKKNMQEEHKIGKH